MPILVIQSSTTRVCVLPLDDTGPAAEVTQVAFAPDPAAAVLALLNKFGFHGVLCRVFEGANLTDLELGNIKMHCERLQEACYRAKLAAGMERLRRDVEAAPPVTVRIAADPYGPDDADDDDGDGDPDKTDTVTAITLLGQDDAE